MKIVYVAGMHRSGTSATMRLLNLLGVQVGESDDLMPAAPDNPQGFWEHRPISALNERLLRALGGSWDHPPATDPRWVELHGALPWIREAEAALDHLTSRPDVLYGVKDPRLSLTLPLWKRIAPDAPVVACLRHPLAVAQSLQARNGLPMEAGAELWLRYVDAVLRHAPDAHLVDYAQLLADPGSMGQRLADTLGLPSPDDKVCSELESWIDGRLDHSTESPVGEGPALDAATKAYEALRTGDRHPPGLLREPVRPHVTVGHRHPSRPTVVLHIGAEKTGTTAIQECLSTSRTTLLKAGVLYPNSVGDLHHVMLAMYGMDDHRVNDLTPTMPPLFHEDRHAWRREVADRLGAEVERTRPQHVVLSSEHFQSQLFSVDEVTRIRDLISPWCGEVVVVLYIRRQDRALASRHSTYLRHGGTQATFVMPDAGARGIYDYDRILALWADVFGENAVVPRVYENIARTKRDIVEDIVLAGRLPIDPRVLPRAPRSNEALPAEAKHLLAAFNRVAPDLLEGENLRRAQRVLTAVIDRNMPGTPALPTRAAAAEVLRMFAESNERVAHRWFGQSKIFDEDLSQYPETDPEPDLLDYPRAARMIAGTMARIMREV